MALHGGGVMSVAAIVYGAGSGNVRRLVVADRVQQLAGHYGPGEDIIILDADEVMASGLPDQAAMVALVQAKRGKPADEGRCIVIDDQSGEIETTTLADPLIDALSGKTLYQHSEASPGWEVDETGEFVAPPPPPEDEVADDPR
jgi:hypothetical protein